MAARKERVALSVPFETKEYPPVQVISLRGITSLEAVASFHGEAYERLFACLEREGARPAGPPFTLYHCPSCNPEAMDVEVCCPTDGVVRGDEEILSRLVPALRVFATIHVGDYGRLHETWKALEAKMKEEGLVAGTPGIEVYLTDPDSLPVEAWRTEVAFSLA